MSIEHREWHAQLSHRPQASYPVSRIQENENLQKYKFPEQQIMISTYSGFKTNIHHGIEHCKSIQLKNL